MTSPDVALRATIRQLLLAGLDELDPHQEGGWGQTVDQLCSELASVPLSHVDTIREVVESSAMLQQFLLEVVVRNRDTDLSRAELRRERGRSALPTATHLFNGMRPIHHRDPGPALAALDAAATGELVVEVIADGVHLDARTVAHVFAIAAEGNVVLVTDAMAAAGMPDGQYRLGALDVTVAEGVATLSGGTSIAGGTAHLLDVVRFAVTEADIDLVRAVRAASSVPATVLGLQERIGSLAAGRRADVLLVDAQLAPVTVLRGGEIVER